MRKILTEAELARLLEVRTMVWQARQVICRSKAILRRLKRRESGDVRIGCPHCHPPCVTCAYAVGSGGSRAAGDGTATEPTTDVSRSSQSGPITVTCSGNLIRVSPGFMSSWCLDYSFGGITAKAVNGVVELFPDKARVHAGEGVEPDSVKIKEAIRWAKGHIEWADEVLRRADKKRKSKVRNN